MKQQEIFTSRRTMIIVTTGNAIGINSPRLFEKLKTLDGK